MKLKVGSVTVFPKDKSFIIKPAKVIKHSLDNDNLLIDIEILDEVIPHTIVFGKNNIEVKKITVGDLLVKVEDNIVCEYNLYINYREISEAEQMFKKLGYSVYDDDDYWKVYTTEEINQECKRIMFFKKRKSYCACICHNYGGGQDTPFHIDLELYKAIAQQMKELGVE